MILRSPHPDVRIPNTLLHDLVLGETAARGDKPALIDGPTGRTITYRQLASGITRVAAALAARGFASGDVLALFAPNLPEFAIAFHGALAAGGVVTTIDSLATAQDLEYQLRNAGPKILVTVPAFLDRAAPVAQRLGIELFVFGEAAGATGARPFKALLEGNTPAPRVARAANDVAVLPYSSGTTGFPKGVMLTHRNLVANLLQIGGLVQITTEDRLIAVLPFFHIYGMHALMNLALWRGATIVTMPRFELEPFLELLQRYRITRAMVVPPLMLALANHPAVMRYDLSSLRAVYSGAAPLDAALQTACAERLHCAVTQAYGLTEASPVTHLVPDGPGQNKPGTVGTLVPNSECRVVDMSSGRDVGPGDDGEILFRGPNVMKGYLGNPEATAATLDAEGWLHTGDIGHADGEGYFTIVDRFKELIKVNAYQVPPAELEAVLRSHPAVADAAVIPTPDVACGEVPKAFVVLRQTITGEELIAYVAERVAPYKRIRAVEVIDAIPKSPAGKILRRMLKDRDRQQS